MPNTSAHRRQSGFSLIELLVVLSIAAVLVVLALPSFNGTIERNRIATQTNEFIAAIMLARTEAIRRNGVAGVCASNDAVTCGGTWADGWIVWADADNDSIADIGEALRVGEFSNNDTLTATTLNVRFNQRGRRTNPVGAVQFDLQPTSCTTGQSNVARRLTMNISGSLNLTKINCS